MPYIHYFHRDPEPGAPEAEYVVLSEDIGPVSADEEFGDDGFVRTTYLIRLVSDPSRFHGLPTNRALYPNLE